VSSLEIHSPQRVYVIRIADAAKAEWRAKLKSNNHVRYLLGPMRSLVAVAEVQLDRTTQLATRVTLLGEVGPLLQNNADALRKLRAYAEAKKSIFEVRYLSAAPVVSAVWLKAPNDDDDLFCPVYADRAIANKVYTSADFDRTLRREAERRLPRFDEPPIAKPQG
jgi:hypothetical protein